jgi:DNA-binding sugar fermentation-stimulating protein
MNIAKLDSVYEAIVVKRPSKTSKTPYVADITIDGGDTEHMAHTAALGCCGMVDKGRLVIMKEVHNNKNICKFKIMLAINVERGIKNIIGIDPKIAEELVETAMNKNLLSTLRNVRKYKREKTVYTSRFDFIGIDQNKIPFIMEVKNVPLADYVDCYAKERKNMDFSDRDINDKIAYFPDGYRKKQKDTVSPRALKHITELTEISSKYTSRIRTIMCYVIQRRDVSSFQASNVDPIYKAAFKKAIESGVEVITLQVEWTSSGVAKFIRDDVPINL